MMGVNVQFLTFYIYMSAQLRLEGGKSAQQSRLSHPVGSQQAGQFAAAYISAKTRGHDIRAMLGAVADKEVIKMYHLVMLQSF